MYNAIVARIYTRPHPKADRLQLGTCSGFQIVTGLETKNGDLGVFFPSDGALSHEFCYENSEYRAGKGQNKNPNKTGYFEENRRIRVIKLRGEKSEGYWVPLANLAWTGADLSALKEGDQFCILNGKLVCEKYYSKQTRKLMERQAQKKARKIEIPMFKKHYDTAQLRYNLHRIPHDAAIYFSEKCHGTSGRTGHVLVPLELPRYKSLWNDWFSWTGLKFETHSWQYISGSRNVTFVNGKQDTWYEGSSFRDICHQAIKSRTLRKGETLYYEIVGYSDRGKETIMPDHHASDPKNEVHQQLKKVYGETITYSYGCDPVEVLTDTNAPAEARGLGTRFKILVYRITHTDEDGHSIDLTDSQVRSRCTELGLESVPLLWLKPHGEVWTQEQLIKKCEELSSGPSTLDSRHIREGVCLKVEHPKCMDVFKFKGFEFCDLEGIAKNSDFYVDPEEVA